MEPIEIRNNRILIVDDNESIHDDFRKILLSKEEENNRLSFIENALFNTGNAEAPTPKEQPIDYIIEDAYQGIEAIQMVQQAEANQNPYALIFMDVRMPPGIDGIETIERIWDINPFIEMVICTAYSDYSWEEIVQRIGSSDRMLFLKKPFYSVEVKQMTMSLIMKRNLDEKIRFLIENLEHQVDERTKELQQVMAELQESNKALHKKNRILAQIAERDALTGLYNHSVLHCRLDELFEKVCRNPFPISVVMIDIDDFKGYNDRYGHQVGDEILLEFSAILKNEIPLENPLMSQKPGCDLRRYDVAARYGGDEFVIVLPYCGAQESEKVAARIMERMSHIKLKQTPHTTPTVSVGIAVLEEISSINSGTEFIKLADQALYNSKQQGKNRMTLIRCSQSPVAELK